MKYGIYGVGLGAMADPAGARLAVLAEELGYESLWTGEHMVLPSPQAPPSHRSPLHPFLDPIVALTFLAAHTSTIRLGTGVLLLPQRHPVQLAKELVSLDVLSRGRLIVGVGVGYMEPELRALGADLHSRGRRTDQHLAAMHELWRSDAPSFKGDFVEFDGVDAYPRPVAPNGPELVIGGASPLALIRTITWASGWYGYRLPVERVGQIAEQLGKLAADAGRPAPEITVTPDRPLNAELVVAYRRAGVHRLVIVAEGDSLGAVEEIIQANAPERWADA
jgi:probable F420-dependent oxidoreductase